MKALKLIFKRIMQIILSLLVLIALFILIISIFNLTPDYSKKLTVAGYPMNTIKYIQLDKETNIWISIWLPESLKSGEKIPTLIETSRYAQHFEMGWLYKCMQILLGTEDINYSSAKSKLNRGYAYIWIQSPGSCQSSGSRYLEYPPNEIDAIKKVIDWIVVQDWSNQKVGAIGGSYSGTTADMSCATMHPALKAVAPNAPDFDSYQVNAQPGGLMSKDFLTIWANFTYQMDQNNVVGFMEAAEGKMSFFDKLILKSTITRLKEPNKEDIEIYKKAIAGHKNNILPTEFMKLIEFKDLKNKKTFGYSVGDIALYNYKTKIEKANVNTYTQVGWMDSGVTEGALQKFLTINSPQILIIGPSGHILSRLSDPYDNSKVFTEDEKNSFSSKYWEFLDNNLKEDGKQVSRSIQYFTYGINSWHETTVWPPKGSTNTKWYFNERNSLSLNPPENETGNDKYKVDFTATTGSENRWMSQMGKPVVYPERSEEDKKLLTYTSLPLEEDTEITGSPTVTLYVSSTHTDGAFHIYFEDVTPSGDVVYLTEGLLRAIHRKEISREEAPYVPLGVYHSFTQKDSSALVPGQMNEIKITLYPISTVFKKGHSIRVAIAGHDAAMQSKYPSEGVPELQFERNMLNASNIELPVILKN